MPSLVSGVAEEDSSSWRSLHDVLSSVLGSVEFAAGLKSGSKEKVELEGLTGLSAELASVPSTRQRHVQGHCISSHA